MMEANAQMADLLQTMQRLERKMDAIENNVVTIKNYLDEDTKLSPKEKEMLDLAISRVKSGNMDNTVSLEDLRKKLGA